MFQRFEAADFFFALKWRQFDFLSAFDESCCPALSVNKETCSEQELKKLLEKPKTNVFSEYRDWVVENFLLATDVMVGELIVYLSHGHNSKVYIN